MNWHIMTARMRLGRWSLVFSLLYFASFFFSFFLEKAERTTRSLAPYHRLLFGYIFYLEVAGATTFACLGSLLSY